MEENFNNNQQPTMQEPNVETKRKKAKKAVITLSTIVVLFLGLQVYASVNGYGNVFFMIRDWTTSKNATGENEVFKEEEKNIDTTEEEMSKIDNEIKYEISQKSNAVATIKATKNGKTISKEFTMTAAIDEIGTMEIPGIGEVALVAETGGEYYGVNVFQLVGNEIKKIGLINCGADMVKDATYTVKTKGEGTVIIDAKTNKETITKEIEMTAAIDKTEVANILKCGKVVFVSETGGEYYAVKVFRASQDYTNGKLTEIKEVGTIQNNIDYVQLEPDNYAEEVMKDDIKTLFFNKLKKDNENNTEKLLDYRVEKVTIISDKDKKGIVENDNTEYFKNTDILAEVAYSVKPKDINNTGWIAGNGEISGEWIKNKIAYICVRNGEIVFSGTGW